MIINPTWIATFETFEIFSSVNVGFIVTLGANAPVLGEHLLGHGQAGDSLGSPRFVLWLVEG